MSSDVEDCNLAQVDSEDEFDWEEVEVPEHPQTHLEITIQARGPLKQSDANKKKGINHAERLLRVDCHKIHTIALIANARIRNSWINDPLLHARLLSLTPLDLQNSFGHIHKSRVPDQNQRGRLFEKAMGTLTSWWAETFFEVIPDGHVRNRTFNEIQQKLEIRGLHLKEDDDSEATIDIDTLQDIVEDEVETIRSSKSLMKHALMQNGSRDTSAQLFTALCRGLGIPARLVVSVQSVPWQAGIGKPKPNYARKPKLKGKEFVEDVGEEASSSSLWDRITDNGQRLDGGPVPQKSEKAKGKEKAKPIVKLRKSKSKGNVLGAPSKLASPDPLTTPPVYWTEVFSRPDAKWFPIDPIRGLVNKRKNFDPSPSNLSARTNLLGTSPAPAPRRGPPTKVENRMVYVIALEEDGYVRDVTRRYAREYGAKVAKVQGGSLGGGGKGRQAWWDKVVKSIQRPYRLHRDDLEDEELNAVQLMEGMPTTMNGFKDHPLYVLTRHLKQTETIHPPPPDTPELGKFRGEPVYPRSSIVSLKTAENWMRNSGRSVRAGEQPMKMVKLRAGTVNRMRELEVLKDELKVVGGDGEGSSASGNEVMQGLYAFSQTELYIPDPVVDGIVPKNNFGNIDLYVPSMLPKGAVHIPFKGVAKIARKLGFDFAEAVIGFEFRKKRALPIIEGVVVATENEDVILEAYWEAEREADEKARIKKEDRVYKLWTRLIHGLRIRQRLQEQYSSKPGRHSNKAEAGIENDDENDIDKDKDNANDDSESGLIILENPLASDTMGGFLAGADKVVQAFHLPKNTHVVLDPTPPPPGRGKAKKIKIAEELEEEDTSDLPDFDFTTYDLEEEEDMTMDVSLDMGDGIISVSNGAPPKTMQQLAEDAAAAVGNCVANGDPGDSDGEELIVTAPPVTGRDDEKKTINRVKPSPRSNPARRASARKATANGRSSSSTTTKHLSAVTKSNGKRRRKQVVDSDSENLSEDDEEEEEEEEELKPSPSKRIRTKASVATSPTEQPTTRTLRPRTSKSAAQIAEEAEMEKAYRKAVAQ